MVVEARTFVPTILGRIIRVCGGEEYRTLSIIWGCIRLISTRISGLPAVIEDEDGKRYRQPVWVKKPAQWCAWEDLLSGAVVSLLHYGNWYVIVERDGAGRVTGLCPLDPRCVTVESTPDGRLLYRVNGRLVVHEIIHQRYIAVPGNAVGVGALDAARMAIKISDAAEGYVARHFSQGAQLQVALTTKDMLPASSKKDIAAQVNAKAVGPENAYAPLVLDGGLDVKNLSMTTEQAQFIELTRWSDAKIAAQIYGLHPSMMGIVEAGTQLTYYNLQDREGQLWRDALGPLARRIQSALTMLVSPPRKLRLDSTQVLSGALKDQIRMAVDMANINRFSDHNVYSINEIRAMTGHRPIAEGDNAGPGEEDNDIYN